MLWRIFTSRKSDILHYLPRNAFRTFMTRALVSNRRSIFLVNDPDVIRTMMVNDVGNYPKSDLVTGALGPLVGNSIFTVSGETWQRQHRMIDQVFAKLRLRVAFDAMRAAYADYQERLDQAVGGTVNIDEEMAFVTADVIFRTMFSRPIADQDAATIFREFTIYQESLPHMTGRVVFRSPAHKAARIPKRGLQACAIIRSIIERIVDERLSGAVSRDDICQIIIECRDPETGTGFTREEMIDQIAFFFLAGHETSASALTWALLCLSQDAHATRRACAEVARVADLRPIAYDDLGKLRFINAIFKEALRLYPPVAFITRYALEARTVRGYEIRPDDLIVIAPWTVQRNSLFWENPDRFDPDRFDPDPAIEKDAVQDGGKTTQTINKGAWIPFGVGPRVCTGAAFASAEAALILAELTRRYRYTPLNPEKIEPVSRLTVRPRQRIRATVERRSDSD